MNPASMIPLKDIDLEASPQLRDGVDASLVARYCALLARNSSADDEEPFEFPHITTFKVGARYIVADGHHRVLAYRQGGIRTHIPAVVLEGDAEEIEYRAILANGAHGKPLNNAEKRRRVERALICPRFEGMSDRDMGRLLGVSTPFVGAIRRPEVAARQRAAHTAEKPQSEKGCNPFTPEATAQAVDAPVPPQLGHAEASTAAAPDMQPAPQPIEPVAPPVAPPAAAPAPLAESPAPAPAPDACADPAPAPVAPPAATNPGARLKVTAAKPDPLEGRALVRLEKLPPSPSYEACSAYGMTTARECGKQVGFADIPREPGEEPDAVPHDMDGLAPGDHRSAAYLAGSPDFTTFEFERQVEDLIASARAGAAEWLCPPVEADAPRAHAVIAAMYAALARLARGEEDVPGNEASMREALVLERTQKDTWRATAYRQGVVLVASASATKRLRGQLNKLKAQV